MKLAVATLLEKGNEMLADLEARIAEVETLMQGYNPYIEGRLTLSDLSTAIEEGNTAEIKRIGRWFYYFSEESSELKGRLRDLSGTYRRIKRVVDALRLTTDESVPYNPNRAGQNSESAAYAQLLDFKADAPSERDVWDKTRDANNDEDEF